MAATTTNKLIASVFILSLLALSPASIACGSCPTPATPAPMGRCPIDTLKLGVCADILGLVHAVIGNPPSGPKCCALIKGLVDLEAAACLCIAIKANILGANLNIPVALSVLLSACQKDLPEGFKCPSS